jgi:hypothetical protein
MLNAPLSFIQHSSFNIEHFACPASRRDGSAPSPLRSEPHWNISSNSLYTFAEWADRNGVHGFSRSA